MSSALRKLRHRSTGLGKNPDPPVLIIRPHKQEGYTCEATSQFLAKAFQRGMADYLPIASMTPDVARNNGIDVFLHSPHHRKKTHIFFLDDDSPPTSDFVLDRLLSLNKPVVAGVTPIKRIVGDKKIILYWSPIIKNEDGKLDNIGIDEMPSAPFVAHRTGGTCLLVRRDVLEKIKPPYQKFEFNERQTKLVISEDMFFIDKITAAGFKIWVDPQSVCHHFHTLDILDMFEIAMQAKQMGYEQAEKDYKIQI